MKRAILRRVLLVSTLAIAMLCVPATADACWRCRLGYYGSCCGPLGWTGYNYSYYAGWGCWGCGVDCCDYACCRPSYVAVSSCCYTPCCAPCYTPRYPGWGLLSRVAYRWRTHHYGYYWGCYSPCWTVSSCCSLCGEVGCDCGVGSDELFYNEPAVVVPEGGEADPLQPTPADPLQEKQTALPLNGALLTVRVPADARVLVNGIPTRSVGDVRRYVSRNLTPGFSYTYEVTAESTVDGRTVAQSKTVHLQAGQEASLAFDMQSRDLPVETALTLHVPSDAKVYLAGNETTGQGPVRTFRTTKLAAGQEWSEYLVRVEVVRGGEHLTKDETITLRAGDQTELTFDFAVDKVAIAR